MIGVGIACIVLGLIFLFVVPWVGVAVGVAGVVLAILWAAGLGLRAIADRRRTGRYRP